MKSKSKSFVVDAGNTRIKIAVFENNEIKEVMAYEWSDENWKKTLLTIKNAKSIFSSVIAKKKNEEIKKLFQPTVIFNYKTPLPINISNYKTPETLGLDRIANAVAIHNLKKSSNALAIDMGTCIKFDLVNNDFYLGGAISPGVEMRFKALNKFTGKLPFINIEEVSNSALVGDSTVNAMTSGVINGVTAEINGIINRYQENYKDLTIFLTGGDANRFDLVNKNCIFVDLNLTLQGLFLILKHNGD